VPFTAVSSLGGLPVQGKVLLIGKDALTAEESQSSRLAAWASVGRTVVVLEQKNPLRYQGLPAAMEPDTNDGRTGFIEDDTHPVFANLTNRDFFTWNGGKEIVYRNAYEKPTRGAKSLLQCDNRLARTALAEVPTGKGLILVSQLLIGETLAENAVAQQLLTNLLNYAVTYKQEFRPVASATAANPQLEAALNAVGVRHETASDPLKALAKPGSIAVVAATPGNLKTLATNLPAVRKFTEGGGWLVFSGLTPEGLADYNRIVGVDHMIRPFRRERVTFPARRSPLTAGLSTADIVLSSGQRINNFTNDTYLAGDAFSYVVDYDDVAPFAKLPEPSYWGNSDADNDRNPYNIVNGFTSSDGWQLIFSMWAGPNGKPQVPMTLPKPQEIVEVEWTGNAFYYPTSKFELVFDGANKAVFTPTPNNETQTFPVPAGRRGKEILVKITDWEKVKEPSVVGIDNIRLKAKRTPEFYRTVKPLLNIGAMLSYERGKGGIVLCNVLFQETEAVPENRRKKQNILATVLRNLKAPFSGGASIIAGAALKYEPIDLSKQANQYRDDKGWFGDKAFTFKDMPTGRQVFGGVPYQIYDFPTSPVPTAVMLGGSGVPNNLPDAVRGIPVNRKADALFFLQSARLDTRRNDREVREKRQYEMARYVITYADGQKATVPLYAEIDIDEYKQQGTPRALPGAQIAWTRAYEGTPFAAVAYAKQWDNPRPNVAIQSIDLEYGMDRRGVPVLLAVTAASAR
jgi:beta-galactosidase